MRIAGIDPGTNVTGIGVLEDSGKEPVLLFSGTIRLPKAEPIAKKLEIIFLELKALFQEWKPDVVALENVFYQKDFGAAVKVGEARAAAMLAASMSKLSVVEYPPARIKQAISGNGRASKDQIQYMVRHILNLKGSLTADSSDAIAVALCHTHARKFDRVQKESTRV